MKNLKIGFIGLLVAGIVAAFFVINLNETAETGKKIDQEEAGDRGEREISLGKYFLAVWRSFRVVRGEGGGI